MDFGWLFVDMMTVSCSRKIKRLSVDFKLICTFSKIRVPYEASCSTSVSSSNGANEQPTRSRRAETTKVPAQNVVVL